MALPPYAAHAGEHLLLRASTGACHSAAGTSPHSPPSVALARLLTPPPVLATTWFTSLRLTAPPTNSAAAWWPIHGIFPTAAHYASPTCTCGIPPLPTCGGCPITTAGTPDLAFHSRHPLLPSYDAGNERAPAGGDAMTLAVRHAAGRLADTSGGTLCSHAVAADVTRPPHFPAAPYCARALFMLRRCLPYTTAHFSLPATCRYLSSSTG